jgi:deoxyribodipyrimidine photo-lyase
LQKLNIGALYFNRDYEPYARQRDVSIEQLFQSSSIAVHQFKDQVIFEPGEIVKADGKPYTVYTPFKNKWLQQCFLLALALSKASSLQVEGSGYVQGQDLSLSLLFPTLAELGFVESSIPVRHYTLQSLPIYASARDFPAQDATSHLSPHLRFGTLSVRKLIAQVGWEHAVFVSELIWREFFMHILYHFPSVVEQNFNPRYNGVQWRNHPEEFQSWCEGQTGYPMVDAGMRQLNTTGTMHNRVRMITASFLCKHLLIDWRWGEKYFAQKLLDYDLSANNGNWQWVAGTGCDAAPYFRIFNPTEQLKKFDPELEYIKHWLPEYGTSAYPKPIVEHRFARKRCLDAYQAGIASGGPT